MLTEIGISEDLGDATKNDHTNDDGVDHCARFVGKRPYKSLQNSGEISDSRTSCIKEGRHGVKYCARRTFGKVES